MTTLQVYAHRLGDPNLAISLKVTIANELRDQVEVFQTLEYPRFLSTLIPVFLDILQNGTPVFVSNAPEQKLRNIILEIIFRLPQTEALKDFASDICKTLMYLMRVENEDNAVVCVKIIIDLHRTYKNVVEDQVQPFLEIVQEIFCNMEQTVKDAFDAPSTPAGSATPGPNPLSATSPRPMSPAADTPETPSKILPKSLFSFKVLTECPIIVVLLFQSHRRLAQENIMKFLPLIFETLSLQAKPQVEAANAARAKGEVFVGVSPEIKNRSVYCDFIVAQVKTMSFLAYILRSYTPLLRPYQNQIPDFVLRLLRECPPESSGTRKELLVATRHILSTELRSSFVPKIDLLLNEKVLIGTGVTSYESLRPLAYSMLADLIHHVRSELTPAQLSRTVYIYSRNLHDASLAPSIQTMCGKLLLNLMDCIMKITNKAEGRELLMRILDAFASKFAALNIQFDACVKHYKKKKQQAEDENAVEEDDFNFDRSRSIHTAAFLPDTAQDGIKDGRFLFKNLAIGLKPLFIGLRYCNPMPGPDVNPQAFNQFGRGFSQDDIEIFLRMFREGLMCFEYYNVDHYAADGSPPNHTAANQSEKNESSIGSNELTLKLGTQIPNEKEILDLFSIVFTLLDPAVFQEIFASQMEFFFNRMLINTTLLHIAQSFLFNEITSQGFVGILIRFLVDRIDRLGEEDMHYSAVMLHLFRLAFMAVNLFPDTNEAILQPYLSNLVMGCFKLATKAKEPANYFLLLRALFKSIGGGRFELLYKEVSPLLQVLLENLNSLLTLAHKPEMRNLFVELCLAVPVRLSTLLPYLPYLMRPLVIALQADQELVSQGLRTMELCNDNLNPEFLDHIMAPVMKELMDALWSHLKPLPYNQQHSHTAMKILGKLGGRNRRMLKSPPKLAFNQRIDSGVSVEVIFDPSTTPHTLSLDKSLEVAVRTLEQTDVDLFYKKHAYEFLKANIALMLELEDGPDDLAQSLYKGKDKPLSEGENTVVGSALKENGMKPKRLSGNGYTKYLSKRVAQEDALRTILVSIMRASTIPELADDAWPFFRNICRHFTLLHIGEAMEAKESGNKPLSDMMDERLAVQNLNTTLLVEAIVKVIASEDLRLRKRAEEALQICFQTASSVMGGKEHVWHLPIFRVFASQFCSCCYKQEWYKKRGGCLGISIMSSQLDMGTRWMREHELDFIRSLLFVLKDAAPEMANVNTAEATQTLSHVLKVCNRPEDDESPEIQQKFQNLIALLLSELSNSNSTVRETIQSSFQLLADLTGNEVTELLTPVRERLVAPIFAKPLRALPFAMQIGHIDAITYCLTLRPPFLEFNDELIRLLHEALALADAEDQALVSRSSQYKNANSLMNLRIVCIKLLSAAMACSDFSNQRQTHTRARIIQVFFKSLYSKSAEVVEAAHRGLKQVLAQQHKLPKELLQQGLRPILTTLSNHKTLNVAGLEGLARLLELLTNYFKVEIGKKLLDHLKQWAEPKVLQEAAGKSLSENHEVKIIVAILNIFHLLPAAAHIFLDDLVTVVLDMEEHLRRTISSPFRPNLIKYLNRYPTETIKYFYEKLNNPRCSRLFVDILSTECASQLRDEVAKQSTELIHRTFQIPDSLSMHYQGVLIVREIVMYDSNWLASQPQVMDCLLNLWRSSTRFERMKKEDGQGTLVTRESLYLARIFITHLKSHPDDIELIFELVSMFAQDSAVDLSFLRAYFLEEVALKYTPARKRKLLDAFLQRYSDNSISSYLKMMTLRHVINPALLVALVRKDNGPAEIFDTKMLEQLEVKVWAYFMSETSEENQYTEDSLRIEMLQMTAMLIQYAPQLLTDLRKEVIKFGWNHLRLEDATSKQAAYVLISRFIATYDSPSKIAIQIYAALLRAHLSEARVLVKQGLDILAPVLPKRVPLQGAERMPTWVRLTRKVVVEDTHSISQLVNVYQLLVRHPDLFYDYREHFLPQIVNALPKLGLLPNATPEHKLLTVELSELILKWERARLSAQNPEQEPGTQSPEKRKADTSMDGPRKKSQIEDATGELKSMTLESLPTGKDYAPSLALRENLTGYLVRLACALYMATDQIQRRLVQRTIDLIRELLTPTLWPDVHIKFSHLERTLTVKEMTDMILPSVCSALEILTIDINHKPSEWFIVNMSQLYRLLETSIKSDHARVQTALYPALVRIFKAIHETTRADSAEQEAQTSDVTGFVSLVDSIITDGITNLNNTFAVLKLLQAACSSRSEHLDPFVPGLIKMLQKLTKEHTVPSHVSSTVGQDSHVNLLIIGLNLLRKRISHLGDQRRWFLTCMIQLIEKSPDVQLLRAILEMISEWTLSKTETFPTIKEKAGMLVKMMTFEGRGDPKLTEDFLKLVIEIYSDPNFARSELTVRLEQAFLLGTRSENPQIRTEFMRVFDRSVGRSLYSRLNYILGVQNWDFLSNTFWLHQALDLLLGVVKVNTRVSSPHTLKVKSIRNIVSPEESGDTEVPSTVNSLIESHQEFLKELRDYDMNNLVGSSRQLQYLDADTTFNLWVELFPMCWSTLTSTERHDLTKVIINLLSKDYHNKQTEKRPNVIQALLTGIARTTVIIKLPPHLVKYLGKAHNAWHTAIEILQQTATTGRIAESSKDDQNNRERTLDALADMYSSLSEQDMFYGLWRRRSTYSETNVAVSCEQSGMWMQAQNMYENAQIKARSGVLPFTESEYMLWEDHWIACTQKLQQWDILTDLAKHDGNINLLLECAWRLSDWTAERELLEQSLHQVADTPTPRHKVFEGFLSLIKSHTSEERLVEFTRICEEGVQLSLRKWHSLPPIVSQSHLPLLQIFQQYLELQEASKIFESLASTTAQNLEQQSAELRSILGTWRERLPNTWDDINVWSDLVAWRQHIFSAINRTYLPLIPLLQPQHGPANSGSGNSFAYRGYHETAWIINRFAHVARKHQLYDVCINYLTKIYTLPNIEIQEAFLKLREQAKCYYQNQSEMTAGLDVINNTNLMYFTNQQKAEFFTLKGMFLAKLNQSNEANEAFVNAVQIELSLPRAWAEWGRYNDRRFKELPKDLSWANNAVSCYLQAAGIYKNAKARKYLLRVLWLLSLDDQSGTISRAFEGYKGDWPVWYWITFIPQLLTALQHKEARHARAILIRIAKQYPQALHFQLRTAKEDVMKRMATPANPTVDTQGQGNSMGGEQANESTPSTATPTKNNDGGQVQANNTPEQSQSQPGHSAPHVVHAPQSAHVVHGAHGPHGPHLSHVPHQTNAPPPGVTPGAMPGSAPGSTHGITPGSTPGSAPGMPKGPLPANLGMGSLTAHPLDEIMAMLKTGYPLLALSMETMVDQIQLKFKPQADEDMYRLVVALYNEGAQQLLTRLTNPGDALQLAQATVSNIVRFADSLYPGHMKTAFVNDFAKTKLNLEEYVAKLRLWRDKFEAMLDARPRKQKLEASSSYLAEFHHSRFDDVEIPGQYLLLKDNANDFLRIDRFLPEVEVVRNYGNCYRRLTIRGNDGTLHPFVIQNPAARQFRREERLMQLFRILNSVLERRKESRMRNLSFHLPAIVPLAPNVRMVQDDPSYCTLYDIYEDHCDEVHMHKDDPLVYFVEKFKNNVNTKKDVFNQKTELINLRMEINDEIANTMVPPNILSKYMLNTMDSYTDYWMLRKQFTSQYATATFMTYIFSVGHRTPHKIAISRSTGNVLMTELLPGWNQANPMFGNGEAIPFRFTPNIQEFITPVGIEGLFTSCLMATARSLTEPELELDQYLSLFVRDELVTWHMANHRSVTDVQFRERVNNNVLQIMTKAQFLSCKAERENTINANKPTNQNVIDLISQASNPQKMGQMECTWMPWL
ncbi:hypothetical protein PHYBLDRAFT_36397 [Phycomyces blakesleeanus NRRL 1555(-)]|uniref:Non-specific serine/threonine protein kinase n=1 Tax=Phycomyces blakesleeanus (strain ATCC 8743b / DSM 1359 / FGSC 10004 / NBRC 33097 / NRRL 1555) TaxID=763407 RepID=A0A162UPW2_PHYB8|nr:hypothetical protein PHYBLDRAFT_36397 [Phycomyces blakesleeanus NRRL 1555(-)]OAD77362.1 hypothetical protein PHYBLDRAFT_36397 [Phycomyces blakesleeanus NRRL 1555(-)]|eukprot:XP_018295402.1 hypothetical protein PHYBLDRAFT_36397 [Phycomyces blakesleeanus NRRL 1555(-)]